MLRFFMVLALVFAGALFAQERPAENISPKLHPHLAAAQRMCNKAYDEMVQAQEANDFDMEGHAAKAKALLVEASHEMKAAAQAANKAHSKK